MIDEEEQLEEQVDDSENPAEQDGEGFEGDGEEGGFDVKKIIIFVVAPLLLLGGVGGGLYFTGMLDGLLGKKEACVEKLDEHGEVLEACPEETKEKKSKDKGHDDSHGDDHAKGKGGSFLPIPTMIVNLNTDDGTPRYLRLTVQLELKNPADLPKVEAVMPRVVDQFQTYLRELRVKDLRGSAGIYRLQTELLWRVNQASPSEIKDVLFQEILIQ